MIFLGATLMVYNICGFVRFARFVRKIRTWDENTSILHLPIVLLVLFFLGYLAVGFFGNPDWIIAGILFGGSVFVFVMYRMLDRVTHRILESEQMEAELLAGAADPGHCRISEPGGGG